LASFLRKCGMEVGAMCECVRVRVLVEGVKYQPGVCKESVSTFVVHIVGMHNRNLPTGRAAVNLAQGQACPLARVLSMQTGRYMP